MGKWLMKGRGLKRDLDDRGINGEGVSQLGVSHAMSPSTSTVIKVINILHHQLSSTFFMIIDLEHLHAS